MKRLPKVPDKPAVVTAENLVQPNLCPDVPPDDIKLRFQTPNAFERTTYNLATYFGHPVTNLKTETIVLKSNI